MGRGRGLDPGASGTGGDSRVRQEGCSGRTLSHGGRGQGRTNRHLQNEKTVGWREEGKQRCEEAAW